MLAALVALVGLALIVAGLAAWSTPLALVAAGLICLRSASVMGGEAK